MDDQTHARVGDYEILGVLGAGGMGKVYKVRNVISDRIEAMKVLLPDLADQRALADRFLREIKLLATLNHPNIAALRTALTWDNQLVMIMEYVEGVTLSALLRRGPIAPPQAIDYVTQVLSALAYAHGLHIIHRDIKPANMMLTQQGVVKLMDFGIARSQSDPVLTQSGSTLGSLQYMSPEQVKGEAADERSDLYSLGVSLYEMVTGQRPFRADNEYAVMLAHLQTPPPPPISIRPDLPSALNDIILMAMAKDPAQRFQSATAMRNALQNVAAEDNAPLPMPEGPRAQADDATGLCASPPPAVIHAASHGSEDARTPFSAPVSASAAPSTPASAPAASAPSSFAKSNSAPPYIHGAAAPNVAPQPTPVLVPPVNSSPGNFQAPSDAAPLPTRAATNRGLYIALGSVIVLVALVAAGLYVPHLKRAHAAGDIASVSQPANLPTPPPPAPPAQTSPAPAESTPAVPALPEAGTVQPAPKDKRQTRAARTDTARPAHEDRPAAQQQALNTPPPSIPAPSSDGSGQLPQLEHDADLLASRAEAVDASLDGLRQNQGSQGLGLRGDIASSQQRMRTYMARAQSALKNRDADAAKKYLGLADTEVSRLEKFLGH